MKTLSLILLTGFAAGWTALAQDDATNAPAVAVPTNAPAIPAATAPANAPPLPPDANDTAASNGELRMNFRGVPLDTVLHYLSEAAGFIVVMDTEVKGKVDVISDRPVSKEEAVELLNTFLNKNGYTAFLNGRTLTVTSADKAKTDEHGAVKSASDPSQIPMTDDIATWILTVRTLNAPQLAKDLAPLLPPQATLTPNEAGNALIMTDTQTSIHRIDEIIKALDGSTVSSVRVFPLKYADAKEVASELKEIFQAPADSSSSSSRSSSIRDYIRMRFGGGSEGPPGGESSGGSEKGHASGMHIVAVADENSNSVVVSAPEDSMAMIEGLIHEIDGKIEDVTEVRVFKLKHADPVEMSDLLGGLFPDDTKTDDNNRSMGYRFSPFFGGYPGSSSRSSSAAGGDQSERMKRVSRVLAVPDRRTASIVVTASKELMSQIAGMIEQLDGDAAGGQEVFVVSLENADVADVLPVLQDLFPTPSTKSSSSTQTTSALSTRQSQNATQSSSTSSGSSMGLGSGAPALH